MRTIQKISSRNLDPQLKRLLRLRTCRIGAMKYFLRAADTLSFDIYIARNKTGYITGWAFKLNEDFSGSYRKNLVGVYVCHKFRKQGIASKLLG